MNVEPLSPAVRDYLRSFDVTGDCSDARRPHRRDALSARCRKAREAAAVMRRARHHGGDIALLVA